MVLRELMHGLPARACALLVCALLVAGCGEPKAPPVPPGMVRVGDRPLEINTPPMKVVARMTEPFPEDAASAADELDAALRDMGLDMESPVEGAALPPPAVLPSAAVSDGPDAVEPPAESLEGPADGSVEDRESDSGVADELAALRSDVARMQAMLDLVLDEFVIELKNENNRLREEVETLQHELEARESQDSALLPPLPRPAEPEPPPAYDAVAEPAPGETIRYAVIKEWGRNAEEAARMNNASTLKGMICAVPPNATDAQLAELGRWLRAEYDAYENINIDVFDDVETARRFAETNSMEGGRRVLNVSRHPATNRDVIALIRPEGTTVIPRETAP